MESPAEEQPFEPHTNGNFFSRGTQMYQFDSMIKSARRATQASEPVLAGNSVYAHALRQMVSLAAQSIEHVQLTGPAGSGFLPLAQAIHDRSAQANECLVNADCQVMSDDHFAIRWRGTLFLGHVGRLSLPVQQALLDWMESEDGQHVRVISSARDDDDPGRTITRLQKRLTMLTVPFTPLAQRKDDIPIMMQRLWAEGSHPLPPLFERQGWNELLAYDWPENFAELCTFAEKASRLYGGRPVGADQVRKMLGQQVARELAKPDFNLRQHLAQEEKLFLIEALLRCKGIVSDAAQLAGINRTTMLAKLKRHGLAKS